MFSNITSKQSVNRVHKTLREEDEGGKNYASNWLMVLHHDPAHCFCERSAPNTGEKEKIGHNSEVAKLPASVMEGDARSLLQHSCGGKNLLLNHEIKKKKIPMSRVVQRNTAQG
jgi:hypothetical protein